VIKQHCEELLSGKERGNFSQARLRLLKVLLIEEFGQVDGALLRFLDAFLKWMRNDQRPFGGVRIIGIGDPLQAAPVKGTFFFQEPCFYKNGNFRVAYLRRNHRQLKDSLFFEILNRLRIGATTVEDLVIINDVRIFGCDVDLETYEEVVAANMQWSGKDIGTKTARLNSGKLDPTRANVAQWDAERMKLIREVLSRKSRDEHTAHQLSDIVVVSEHQQGHLTRRVRGEDHRHPNSVVFTSVDVHLSQGSVFAQLYSLDPVRY
jgi:hypothetical protein